MSEQQAEFEPQSLDTIFAAADRAEEETEAPKAETVEKTPDAKADEATAETKDEDTGVKQEDESSPPDEEAKDSDKPNVPLAALMDERDKRKSLEQRIQQLEQEKAQAQPEKKPSVFEDEDQYRQSIVQEVEQNYNTRFLAMSEKLAVDQYGKETVETAINRLSEYAQENPLLAARFRDAASPFHEAVAIVQEQEKANMALTGEYDKKIAELTEQLEQLKKTKAEEDEIPSSLAGESGTGVSGNDWSGPTDLKDALQSN